MSKIRVNKLFLLIAILVALVFMISCTSHNQKLQRMKYNNPGLEVDLGVGLWAWPLPMDYDDDGDYDLLVSCPDKPYNGIYLFENTSGDVKMPVFEPGVKVAPAEKNIQPSYIGDHVRLLTPGQELADFINSNFKKKIQIYDVDNIHPNKVRANQWRYCDYDGDNNLDLIVGVGDWTDYGWDNAFNAQGEWTRGPLHGYIYLLRNRGTNEKPEYESPKKLNADGKPIDVYGMPTPNFVDMDNDGDLDLVCGEFLDRLTFFENIGTRQKAKYTRGQFLSYDGKPITMDLEMIVPVAFDWDKDGDVDFVVGQEDGRVAFIENTGLVLGSQPQFLPPQFFRQRADDVKFGALVTPVSYDWDGDGDEDLLCGNTAGYIGFIENLDGGDPPAWAEPIYLGADNKVIRIQAGYNGSIQGPCEAKWGYTTISVADWDHDKLPDILVNSIWGKILWYRNIGTRTSPKLSSAKPIKVNLSGENPKPAWYWWQPEENNLVTQWRTTPSVVDFNQDGLNDIVMLDHEGYLALFERVKQDGELVLMPGKRVFHGFGPSAFDGRQQAKNEEYGLLQLNTKEAGGSGRRKLCFADWDQDGKMDLLVNSKNVTFLRNVSEKNSTEYVFQDMGELSHHILAGHTTSPTIVDWDKNGVPDLLIGAEDGYFYYVKNKLN